MDKNIVTLRYDKYAPRHDLRVKIYKITVI